MEFKESRLLFKEVTVFKVVSTPVGPRVKFRSSRAMCLSEKKLEREEPGP